MSLDTSRAGGTRKRRSVFRHASAWPSIPELRRWLGANERMERTRDHLICRTHSLVGVNAMLHLLPRLILWRAAQWKSGREPCCAVAPHELCCNPAPWLAYVPAAGTPRCMAFVNRKYGMWVDFREDARCSTCQSRSSPPVILNFTGSSQGSQQSVPNNFATDLRPCRGNTPSLCAVVVFWLHDLKRTRPQTASARRWKNVISSRKEMGPLGASRLHAQLIDDRRVTQRWSDDLYQCHD